MKLVFVAEARFIKDKFGHIYGDASYDEKLWARYLQAFDHVYVFCRVNYDPDYVGDVRFISNVKNVTFIELPYYIGPFGFLKHYFKIRNAVKNNLAKLHDCKFILRVPGVLGCMVASYLTAAKKKYALEVVGDPDAVFSSGGVRHPLNLLFRFKAVRDLKEAIKNTSAVLYVTSTTLQKKYPPSAHAYSTCASDVRLDDHWINSMPRRWVDKDHFTILSIGSLAQMYKSPDVLLKAMAAIKKQGIGKQLKLVWLGDGMFKYAMISLSEDLGIHDDVCFLGNVSTESVFSYLQQADLFVLASRTEGLPRAVIEAMGKGLPVIGTNVGGIPELIDESVLVQKDNVLQLSEKIIDILSSESFYNDQAKRNLDVSAQYRDSILSERRMDFYRFIMGNL